MHISSMKKPRRFGIIASRKTKEETPMKKILIVDDDPGLSSLLERFFVSKGYRARAVPNVEQMDRLLRKKLFASPIPVDEENRIRMDDWEMDSRVQSAVDSLWNQVTDENLKQYADLDGYWKDFYQLFGFCFWKMKVQQLLCISPINCDPQIYILNLLFLNFFLKLPYGC